MNEVVFRRLQKFQEKLLDPTKRNRLLNFRVTRASTIHIVDELPAEVFRLLVHDRKALSFLPGEPPVETVVEETDAVVGSEVPEEGSSEDSDATSPENLADGSTGGSPDGTFGGPSLPMESAACDCDGDVLREAEVVENDDETSSETEEAEPEFTREFQPYDPARLSNKHTDLDLQTDLDDKRLDHNLLRIYQQSRSSFEEQGYNSLFLALGAVRWFETDAPTKPLLAPILLVPVELRRRSPRSPFRLYPSDDDPVFNPSLQMKLERELKISIPELPDDLEEFSLQEFFAALAKSIGEVSGSSNWCVLNDVYLGLFSFTKFIMYKDLETFAELFSENSLIRTLCGVETPTDSPTAEAAGDDLAKLADETERDEASIDARTDPLSTFQVLDADSSQQEAILAIKSGENLVLEGPPGTGKSQTITNIVAECLASNRRVLFVSEKMAALEVVYNRLREVGLADFCLELHSRHASKRKVVEELGRTLALKQDRSNAPDTGPLERVAALRGRLNDYVEAIADPLHPLESSPFDAIGQCIALDESPEVVAEIPDVPNWTGERLEGAREDLRRFVGAWKAVQERFAKLEDHPWRGSGLPELGSQTSTSLRQALDKVHDATATLQNSSSSLAELVEVGVPATITSVRELLGLVDAIRETPHPSLESLRDSAWIGTGQEILDLIELAKRYRSCLDEIEEHWKTTLLDERDLDAILDRARKGYGALKLLKPAWWRDRAALKSYLSASGGGLPVRDQLVEDLEKAIEARKLRERLRSASDRGRVLFGTLWKEDETDPAALEEFASWVTSFREFVLGEETERRLRLAVEGLSNPTRVEQAVPAVRDALETFENAWEELAEAAKIDGDKCFDDGRDREPIESLLARVELMRDEIESLHDWGRYVASDENCRELGLDDYLDRAFANEVAPDDLIPAFERLFFNTWLDHATSERHSLRQFSRPEHQRAIDEFRELDLGQLRLARQRLRSRLLSALPDASWPSSERSELGVLQREVRRKRGHKPLRKLFQSIPGALTRLKPCFLMSPLSVAQFLDPGVLQFDVVIFDEASQIAPEDALGAIARGSQLVVVGDSRQLPPTAFFQSDGRQGAEEDDDTPDLESVLDECVVAGFPRRMLRWHYRSRHESLIAFSNENFYEGRLNTFPSASRDGGQLGVDFIHVEDGVYDRGKSQSNKVEADRVARAVLEHFRTRPELSLGVGTFSQAQQVAILDRLEELRRQDESLEEYFTEDRLESFFVKNLENIQGDERDHILLSVGYGRDADGKIHLNFGPLNKTGGGRRLNVLVTRARRKLIVYSSIRGSDIDTSRVSGQGPQLLKRYLEFAERSARGDSSEGSSRERSLTQNDENGLAQSVLEILESDGFSVDRDVGCSRVRIDLAVRKDGSDDYLIGVECDGESYCASGSARDRDRLRPQVLEGLGWNLYRIWSPEWLRNPRAELERIRDAIDSAHRGEASPEVLPLIEKIVPREIADTDESDDSRERVDDASDQNGDGRFPGVISYTSAKLELSGDPEDFGADEPEVIARLLQVVESESPIHVDEAGRRVAASWGVTRLTSKVQEIIARAIESTLRDAVLFGRDDFLWNDAEEVDSISPRARDSDEAPREPELIAVEELAAAARLILAREFRISRADLITQVAKVLGFGRAGARMRDRVGLGLDGLVESSLALEDENGFRLIDSERENHTAL